MNNNDLFKLLFDYYLHIKNNQSDIFVVVKTQNGETTKFEPVYEFLKTKYVLQEKIEQNIKDLLTNQ